MPVVAAVPGGLQHSRRSDTREPSKCRRHSTAAAFVRSRSTFLNLAPYEQAAAAGDAGAAFDLGVLLMRVNPPDLAGARR